MEMEPMVFEVEEPELTEDKEVGKEVRDSEEVRRLGKVERNSHTEFDEEKFAGLKDEEGVADAAVESNARSGEVEGMGSSDWTSNGSSTSKNEEELGRLDPLVGSFLRFINMKGV
jgi:hypothetical protein